MSYQHYSLYEPKIIMANRFLKTEIINGKHVRTEKVEHQKHLRRPSANTLDANKIGDDFFIGHVLPIRNTKTPILEKLR